VTLLAAKIIWCLGVVSWFVIRYPHARRSRRISKSRIFARSLERVLLLISSCGLGVLPALFVFSDLLKFADYPIRVWQPWAGLAIFGFALWMFRETHAELGRNWSVTLELRTDHSLVTDGIYARVRHPMYTAFWLWALAQAVLLPNWIAGPAGIVGFGTLYFFRVGREEAMLLETFGKSYSDYMSRTGRVMPRLR
jgi:protein-S-isoprenylcysteine O-methyltransferase Ste14